MKGENSTLPLGLNFIDAKFTILLDRILIHYEKEL